MNKARTPIAELRPSHGVTDVANTGGHRTVPSLQDLMDIPAAVAGIYEMREEDIKRLRSRIYALNKDNHFGWRWRTLMERTRGRYHTLLVWRIH
jgi:hypothetical protein